MSKTDDTLPDDPATLKAMLLAERVRSERLVQNIKELQRHRFERSAETLPEDQMLLALEDIAQSEAGVAAETKDKSPAGREAAARKRRVNRGSLPAHLLRVEMIVDIDDKTCPCCKGPLHRIGEDASERLDILPARFRVLVTRRPKYACHACEEVVAQAPAPARLIEGGIPTEATVAHVLVSKYADHLPLYRQAQIYARQGIDLDRSTLADWVGRAAFHLRPVHERLLPISGRRRNSSPTRRRRRCSIRDVDERRQDNIGPTRETTGHGAEPTRPPSPVSTHPIGRRSDQRRISLPSMAC
jgi:transposase